MSDSIKTKYEVLIDRAKSFGAQVTQHEIGFTHHEFANFMSDPTAPQAGQAAPAGEVASVWKLIKLATHNERSWPEDSPHENGVYFNDCVICQRSFTGHKRRAVCRVCATPATEPAAPSESEQTDSALPDGGAVEKELAAMKTVIPHLLPLSQAKKHIEQLRTQIREIEATVCRTYGHQKGHGAFAGYSYCTTCRGQIANSEFDRAAGSKTGGA